MKHLKRFFFAFVVIINIAFPKGGFKIADVPITWGYLTLLLSAPFCFFFLIKKGMFLYLPKQRRIALLLCMPFVLYSLCIVFISGYKGLGYLLSFLLSLSLMPLIFLVAFNGVIDQPTFSGRFNRLLLNSVRLLAVFGLFLFAQKILTGSALEIPYLTVNAGDVGEVDTKYNLRGDFMKFVSTYNNGNIYGICMLIFLPLYISLEKHTLLKVCFLVSLALTLSRTVWIGMVVYAMLYSFSNLKTIKGWSILAITALFLLVGIPLIINFIGFDTSFLTDRDLGGRAYQVNKFTDFTLFGSMVPFEGLYEIVYSSILDTFGLIGLILFIPYLFSPLIVYGFIKRSAPKSHAHWGLIIYTVICMSDGAILLIPTMAFFWFLSSYVLRLPRLADHAEPLILSSGNGGIDGNY